MGPNRATCWEEGLWVGCQSAGHFQRPTGPLEAADATVVWLLEQHVKALTAAARDTAHTQRLMKRSTAHVETLMLGPGVHRGT